MACVSSPMESLNIPSFLKNLLSTDFYQHNYVLNSHNSLLDLVFSNLRFISVSQTLDTALPPDSYHPPLSLSINISIPTSYIATYKSFYNFNKANYQQITNFLNSYHWKRTFLSYTLDDCMTVFLDALHNSIVSFVPKVSYRPFSFPSWFTHELKELVFAKTRAHAKFKASMLLSDYKHFSLLRAKFKFLSKQCYRYFISRTESSLQRNPRYFWTFVRKNRSSPSIPSSVSLDGVQSNNHFDTANLFSKYFSSVITQPSNTPSLSASFAKNTIHNFALPSNVYFSVDDVYNCLYSLRNKKSVGPDGIQGDFLFKIPPIIAEPL